MTPTHPIRILILVANPFDRAALTLDEEYQRIHSLWRSCNLRDQFDIHPCFATRADTLQSEALQFKPHLIHFSGHGTKDSVIFADLTGYKTHEVSKIALANLFKLCAPDLKAIFLNACHSAINAEEIAEQVDYFIGMNDAIDDKAGTVFSQGFYSAIFNQTDLDIEQAFKAGLNQMAIAHIANAEQQLRVLQKRPKTYVPSYQHDIFISFADEDTQWANNFISVLKTQLKAKLATFDGFQLYSRNDFEQLAQSAMLLVIASPAYCQQYQSQFAQLETQTKQQPVFLVEYDVCKPRPEFLKGFTPYKFWRYDDNEGMMSVTGDDYVNEANKLASAIAKRLIELKNQQQRQQTNELQLKQQQDARVKDTCVKPMEGYVFLHSGWEDFGLLDDIVIPLLDENNINYALPFQKTYTKASSEDIKKDINDRIEECKAVLILHEQSAPTWARNQLGICANMLHKREKPLKIIALYKNPDNPDPGFPKLEHLHIYSCSPEQLSNYLPEFIKELTHE